MSDNSTEIWGRVDVDNIPYEELYEIISLLKALVMANPEAKKIYEEAQNEKE